MKTGNHLKRERAPFHSCWLATDRRTLPPPPADSVFVCVFLFAVVCQCFHTHPPHPPPRCLQLSPSLSLSTVQCHFNFTALCTDYLVGCSVLLCGGGGHIRTHSPANRCRHHHLLHPSSTHTHIVLCFPWSPPEPAAPPANCLQTNAAVLLHCIDWMSLCSVVASDDVTPVWHDSP